MSDKPVRQVCPTWDRTILSNAMSNKTGSMGLSDMGSDDCVQSRVEQPCLMRLSDMGSNRLFHPMIFPMRFYSSDRLFNSSELVAEQAGRDLLGRTCLAKSSRIAGRPAVSSPGRPTGRPALSLPSRPQTCARRAGHLTCSQRAGQ